MSSLRRLGWALAVAAATASGSAPAWAHALAERYDLPVPLGLYLGAAGAVVALSFVALALLWRRVPNPLAYPSIELGRSLAHPLLRAAPGTAAAAVFLLIVAAGLVGTQSAFKNIAPVAVWVVWWVGFAFVAALVGNIWPALNPWRALFDAAIRSRTSRPATPPLAYPDRLGAWPAVLVLLVFVWMELVWDGAERPSSLAVAILVYSALTWSGMALFGAERWLARADAFSLFYSTLGRFAPLFEREGGLRLRPYGAGLLPGGPADRSMLAFVILMLTSVTFDGFLETPVWAEATRGLFESPTLKPFWAGIERAGLLPYSAVATAALLLAPLALFAIYWGTCWAVTRMGAAGGARRGTAEVAGWFVFTLVPIAIAYHVAHYLSYLLVAGQLMIPLASDPFGYGWDLFGTTLYRMDIGIIDARTIWIVAVAAIVAGHVAAVFLAHRVAHALFADGRDATRSQLPMLLLMVGYTMTSLWILAQPIVEAGG